MNFLLACGASTLFSYYVFRVLVRNDYVNKQKLSLISGIFEVAVFALHANLIYFFVPAKWPYLPTLPSGNTTKIIALLVLITGVVLLILAWLALGSNTSFGDDNKKLYTGSVYAYSRNPQLLGYGLILLSVSILYLSWHSIVWFVMYVLISSFMIKSEEEFLQQCYGTSYLRYCQQVSRFIKWRE